MNMKKILAVLLAVCLAMAVAACGKKSEEAPADPQKNDSTQIAADVDDAVGAFALIGQQQVIVHYDEDGKVMAITDRNNTVLNDTLVGKPATEAVQVLLTSAENPICADYLLIMQRPDSLTINKDFFPAIEKEAKAALEGKTVILSTAADQNEYGYMSPETAQAVLAAYLGAPEGATYSCTTTAVDGYYHITVFAGNTADYSVGALYGTVEQIIEESGDIYTDDIVEGIPEGVGTEEFIEEIVDNSTEDET